MSTFYSGITISPDPPTELPNCPAPSPPPPPTVGSIIIYDTRKTKALERIAAALEKLAKEK
jgi:hypothetical protein